MFKRQIQISMVKRPKAEDSVDEPSITPEDVVAVAKTIVVGTGFVALELMASYMALDTVRKIAINRLSK